ncbi:hypothetical protein DFJ74DRAFT_769139 [Hyaloraphidium curvatum]|nr:hypothetical protein DFJ74DRAFT_769139 [Hyaloraphidium curvatum]
MATAADTAIGRGHTLHFTRTAHARLLPTGHSFRYDLFHLLLDVDALDARNPARSPAFPLFGCRAAGDRPWLPPVVEVREEDYLAEVPGRGGMRARLEWAAARVGGIPPAEIAGPLLLFTMPRVFGVAFNPLNVWFCYSAAAGGEAPKLRCTVAEVNNTFGERFLYVLDHGPGGEGTKTLIRKGYTHAHILPRTFHVSPFSPRTGLYAFQVRDPLLSMKADVAISHWAPIAELPAPEASVPEPTKLPDLPDLPLTHKKHLHARLWTTSATELTSWSLLRALLMLPLAAFLTFPRILWEAWALHYARGLAVFGRPVPLRDGRKRGTLRWVSGGERGWFETWLESRGLAVERDWDTEHAFAAPAGAPKIVLRSPEFGDELALHAAAGRDPLEAWAFGFARGDWDGEPAAVLRALLDPSPSPLPTGLASRLASKLWPSTPLFPSPTPGLARPPSPPRGLSLLLSAAGALLSRYNLESVFGTNWAWDTSSHAVCVRIAGYRRGEMGKADGTGGREDLMAREGGRWEAFEKAAREVGWAG